jgi:ADP-heptose:LPS heptosyltransferase
MKRLLRLLLLHLLAQLARPFVRRADWASGDILYIKPDHLGDLLLATPALAALRQRFPEARITALVGPWSQVVLQRNPDADIVLTCPFPGFERRPPTTDHRPPTTGHGSRLREWSSVVSRRSSVVVQPYLLLLRYGVLLRASRYDLAIVGRDDHWWGAALALLAGVPRRVGFAVPECRPFLSDCLPWDPRDHVTKQGLALVAAVEPRTKNQEPLDGLHSSRFSVDPAGARSRFSARFDPSADDITWADDWLRAQNFGTDELLVVMHPGTGGPAKLWLPERWAQVADALQTHSAHIILTGGPDERALVGEVARHMRADPLTLVGQTTVGQLAALMRRAALVLGVDSGPLHLAAAQGVATLHLYGPGDARRFGPWGEQARHVIVRAELWCSPCGVFAACPRGLAQPECMELIEVAAVVERARALLATARSLSSSARAPAS